MLSKLKWVEVYRKDIALSATGNTKVDITSEKMPSGLVHGLRVRLKTGAITGFGSAQTTYPRILRSATWGASLPNFNVGTGIPGEYLDDVTKMLNRKATSRTTPTASAFDIDYYLPFSYEGSDRYKTIRRKDTALLNINNKAQPFASLSLGPCTDLSSAATACTVTVIVEAEYEPIVKPGFYVPDNPLLSGDQPLKMLQLLVNQKSDLSTNIIHKFVNAGDYEFIGAFFRELSSSGTVVSDIFTAGVATPSKCVLTKGDADAYTPDIKLEGLDARMADEFGLAMVTGYHAVFAAGLGKLSEAIDLRGGEPLTLAMDYLATTASRVIEFMQIGTIDIPKAVLDIHAAQLGVKAS